MSALPRPITLLIAALGGEGGGVLTNWIVAAAHHQGLPVQSTSIPGVAQRTGATTYYVELFPVAKSSLDGRVPVLCLTPSAGDVDIFMASELLEATRAVTAGYVTKDRTRVIASTARQLVMPEKMAMGDGRLDSNAMRRVIDEHARSVSFYDMSGIASSVGAMTNSVMLGILAGQGCLPISPEAFEAALNADGKGGEANLRGFRAGFAAAPTPFTETPADGVSLKRMQPPNADTYSLEREVIANVPAPAQEYAIEGVRRLARFQSIAYARDYVDRLLPICRADIARGGTGVLARECARHLALRMAYDDVVRVAAAKIDPARLAGIARKVNRKPDETLIVREVLKPGIEEICSLLPPLVARPLLRLAKSRGWLGRIYWPMELNSTSVTGYLRLALLAKLRVFRPYSLRFAEEMKAIKAWLCDVQAGSERSLELAMEIVGCAQLIKGYGSTHQRSDANYALIHERLIAPALRGEIEPVFAAQAILNARAAALADPEGKKLAACLEAIDTQRAKAA